MGTPRSRRAVLVLVAVVSAGFAGACGGGGGAQTPAAPAVTVAPAPGAAIDPSSNNVITGPINQARTVAGQASAHEQQLDQQTGTGQP